MKIFWEYEIIPGFLKPALFSTSVQGSSWYKEPIFQP